MQPETAVVLRNDWRLDERRGRMPEENNATSSAKPITLIEPHRYFLYLDGG
jgi:hypothetical protein